MVVTSGTFDGVHYGHRKIFKRLVQLARANNGKSVVLTFWPHPRFVLGKNNLKLLSTLEEKTQLIADEGIDYFVKIPFTREFSQLTSSEFIQQILVEGVGTNILVIGYDHRFGKNREGSFDYLKEHSKEYGFEVEEIPAQDIDNISVSSSKIRRALQDGQISIGNDYLGRPYSFSGTVVGGEKIGRSLGYPTANINIEEEYKLVPADGIYAVEVKVKNRNYRGMLYIGPRPTLNGKDKTIEVNIFDFSDDIYDERITVDLIQRIRGDARFDSLEELKNQLTLDKAATLEIFEDYPL